MLYCYDFCTFLTLCISMVRIWDIWEPAGYNTIPDPPVSVPGWNLFYWRRLAAADPK